MLLVTLEPEGALRCNACFEWLGREDVEEHGRAVHGDDDVMVVHTDDL